MTAEGAVRGAQAGLAFSRRQVTLALGTLLAVTALAYAGTFFAGFVWDDIDWIGPAAARSPGQVLWESFRDPRPAASGFAFTYYRPLLNPTFALDGRLWGLRPGGFHLTNLLFYLACIALAFLLARRLLGSAEAALVAAAAFALHPVHVESVAWVIARADLMAFAGTVAALLAFAVVLERGPSWPRLGGMAVAFLAAALSKEAALVAPGLAVACWAFAPAARRAPARRAAWALAPLLLSLGVYGILRAAAIGNGTPSPDRLDPHGRWMLAPVIFAKYVALLFWPHPLTAYYDLPIPAAGDPRRIAGMALFCSLLAATAWAARRAPRLALAPAWFLLGVVPVLHIVPLKGFIMAERYLFLPSFGFALAVGLAGEAVWRRAATRPARLAWGGCAAVVACAWLALIMARVPDWVERVAFYRAMVRTAPQSAFAHVNLGQALANAGMVEEGIVHLDRAVSLQPDMAEAQVRLGLAYWQHGELPRAIAPLETAARLHPRDPRIQRAFAIALGSQGRTQEAVDVLRRLEALQPDSIEAARQLAVAYAALGDRASAERYAARAEQLASRRARRGDPQP